MAEFSILLEPWPLARQPRARQKPACSTNCMTCTAAAASMASALHCTAPHSTAPHGRMRHEMHLCTLSFHFLARFARVLVLTAAMDALLLAACAALPCGRWQSEAWRARHVREFRAGLEVGMQAACPDVMPSGGCRPGERRGSRCRYSKTIK